jgi:thiol:disulfide interchange protein DsbC
MSVALASLLNMSYASAQNAAEQKVKTEVQKQLGDRAKVTAVRSTPINGLYEVAIGSDVVYADASARYLIQGEVIDLKTGINLTEQRSNDLNRIKWADLPLNDAIKVVRGKGTRQIAVFADPNCGFCKKLEKSFQQLDNVTIYTFLVPLLSQDSAVKSKQIWCSSDKVKSWNAWMLDNQSPSGQGDCATPLDRNTSLAKKLGVTGTPAMFFTDGSRISGAVPLASIEKKLK